MRAAEANGIIRKADTRAWTCKKRDGSVVAFDPGKIRSALRKCFARTIDPDEAEKFVVEVADKVVNGLAFRGATACHEVEEIQRVVIQQLWAAGLFDSAEHYQNFREKQRKARLDRPITAEYARAVAEDQSHFPSQIQYYQLISKFARWREEDQRRETWREACDRVMGWFRGLPKVKLTPDEWQMLDSSLYNLQTCCAMRVVQMAGPALDRCNMGVYNCAGTPIDDLRSFAELLYILMAGSGCGFSVEDDYISQLPRIAKQKIPAVKHEHKVADSTEGWCDALLFGLERWFDGEDVWFDVSGIRKKNSRLKTKGGRASGPEPFLELISFARKLIMSRQGRVLTDLDVHDLCCMIGKIVQVGGVRRAACCSISDLHSQLMRDAKSGNWYQFARHRTMANNSAAYDGRPDIDTFMAEFSALIKSKSGERGTFNRKAILDAMPIRRNKNYRFLTNPCVPDDTWVMTASGARRVKDLRRPFVALVDGVPYQASAFKKTGEREVFHVVLANGSSFDATSNHLIRVVRRLGREAKKTEWKELGSLSVGDRVVIHNHRRATWPGPGTESEGYLLGSLLGDGCFSGNSANLDFWGETREEMRDTVLGMIRESVAVRSHCRGTDQKAKVGKIRVGSTGVKNLADGFDIGKEKLVGDKVEQASSDFYAGFLRGWFDADGTVGGSQKKGVSVRLGSSILENLKAAQRMLARMGINSVVYQNRNEAGYYSYPDGRGGSKEYWRQAGHELVVANDNLLIFSERIGFGQPDKKEKLSNLISSYKRRLNRDRFAEKIVSIQSVGVKEVFDCSVPGPEAFDANGAYVHNCYEITFRPRGLCNLSIVVARPWDTPATLRQKVRIAAYWGCMQKTATKFQYVRDEWRKNAEEESLLGVDITGHADCPCLRPGTPGLAELLQELKQIVREVDIELSARFDVNESAANTCVKPGGDSSVFFDCGSGTSPWFDEYFIRWVREPATTPVAQLLISEGVPYAPAPEDPALLVFGFPRAAPSGAPTRHDMTAIQQLENWLVWKKNWAEHSVSSTIYVDDHEWPDVIAWVWKHFDEIPGLAFLPRDNGIYTYPPNEALTQQQYDEWIAKFPEIHWEKLCRFEEDDQTVSSSYAACVGGSCAF